MSSLQIAVESELSLHTPDGLIANKAERVVAHPRNAMGKAQLAYPEGTEHQIEIKSPPVRFLEPLSRWYVHAYALLEAICQEEGLMLIPGSENGAGRGEANQSYPGVQERIRGYKVIFGRGMVERLLTVSGLHIHYDIDFERPSDQFNFLTALRPAVALASTSPLSAEGKNGYNCYRYHLLADPAEGVFASMPEERGYIRTLDELEMRMVQRFERWDAAFRERCEKHTLNSGFFRDHFPVERTGYPDIRYRPDMGEGTYEWRVPDSATADVLLGMAALVKGSWERIMNGQIPVLIAPGDYQYFWGSHLVILPHKETIDDLTRRAVHAGVKDYAVQEYLQGVIDFAAAGLSRRDQQYLAPLQEMLTTGKNTATRLLEHLGQSQTEYLPAQSAQANIYMGLLQREALERLHL